VPIDQKGFLNLLNLGFQKKASDIHLVSGSAPAMRLKGDLLNVNTPPLTEEDMAMILGIIITDQSVLAKVKTLREYDGSFEVKNLGRFRVNVLRNRGKIGAVLRLISDKIPTIEELGLPPVLKTISEMHRGLVLVTGVTGSGKSSTLASMIDYLNKTAPLHILTIEDPIEFVHQPKKARITQREVGRDTDSFASALRAALRQDPDVILVGEMRDQETIDIALKAAETGHMVFSTVHTVDAVKTIGRLVAVFPPSEQKMVRLRLSENITATISQRLIRRDDTKGMIAAQEIMINSLGVAECIANENLTGGIKELIQNTYSEDGTGGQTFDQHLVALFKKKILSLDTAMEAATNPADFQQRLMFGRSADGNEDITNRYGGMAAVVLDREEAKEEKSGASSKDEEPQEPALEGSAKGAA
jgi:twitching motility protein PilT